MPHKRSSRRQALAGIGLVVASQNGWWTGSPKINQRWWESTTAFRFRSRILSGMDYRWTGRHSWTTSNTIGRLTEISTKLDGAADGSVESLRNAVYLKHTVLIDEGEK